MTPTSTIRRPGPFHGPIRRPGEIFDLNSACVAGVVQKLWPRSGDVYARVRILNPGEGTEAGPRTVYCNLRFPEGKASDQPISLQAGEVIQVSGYLTHNEYFETIHRFLQEARAPGFLEGVPQEDLSAWQAVAFRRINLMLNVRTLACRGPDGNAGSGMPPPKGQTAGTTADPILSNQIALEGIVARRWEYADHLFVRLSVYDRFTPIERGGQLGKHGRPRRKPHYIPIRFTAGAVGGRPVTVRLKDGIRITGAIGSQLTEVSLHQALLETGSPEVIELLGRLPNADQVHEIHTKQESLYVEAASLIAYTGRSEGG